MTFWGLLPWTVAEIGPPLSLLLFVLVLGGFAGWFFGLRKERSCGEYLPDIEEFGGATSAAGCELTFYCPACMHDVADGEVGPNGEHEPERGGCGGRVLPLLARFQVPIELDS